MRMAPRGRPASAAARIWSSAISGLVWKVISSGTPAFWRRAGSSAHSWRQVEAIGDGQAGRAIGERERHRHLALVLFAELAAALTRDPDRVPALLGKAGIVDDPGLDGPGALDGGQHQVAHLG